MSKQQHRRISHVWRECLPAVLAGVTLPLLVWWSGCLSDRVRPPRGRQPVVVAMEVTGYCNCGLCCSWERGWLGLGSAVVSSGPNKGKPKAVGITASGARAQYGTIAADTEVLPFGTIVYVPGYGYGRVEDRGGAIKGRRLDLWYPSHRDAQEWGRKKINVRVWR